MNTQPTIPAEIALAGLRRPLPDMQVLYADVHAHSELSMPESRPLVWPPKRYAPELATEGKLNMASRIHFFRRREVLREVFTQVLDF